MEQTGEPQTTERKLLTPADVAVELNVSLNAVYNLLRSGDLPAVDLAPSNKPGRNKFYRIPRRCLDEFLRSRRTGGVATAPSARQSRSFARAQRFTQAIPNYLGL